MQLKKKKKKIVSFDGKFTETNFENLKFDDTWYLLYNNMIKDMKIASRTTFSRKFVILMRLFISIFNYVMLKF